MSTPPPAVDDQDTVAEPNRVFTFTDPDEDGVPDFYDNEDVDPGSDEESEHYAQRWTELGLDAEAERAWTGAVDRPATPLLDPVASSSTYTPSIVNDEETFATVDRAGFDRAGSISADADFRRVMDSYRSMENDAPNAVAAPVGENTGSYDDIRRAVNDALADANGADTNGADTNGADTNGADTNGADTNGADTNGADTNDVCMVPAEPFGLASGAQIMKDAVSYDSMEDLAHLLGSHIVEAIEQDWWDWEETQGVQNWFEMGDAENLHGDSSPSTENQVPVPTPANNRVTFDRIHVVQDPDAVDDLNPDPIVMTTEDSPRLTSHVARIRQVESLPGYRVLELLRPVVGLGTVEDDIGTVEDDIGTVEDDVGTVEDDIGTVEDDIGTVEEIGGVSVNLNPHPSLLNRPENAQYGNHLNKAELRLINWVSSSLSRFVRSVPPGMHRSRARFRAAKLKRR